MKSKDNASISAMCSPSGYYIYLFTIVLYRGSVKRLLSERPGEKPGRMSSAERLSPKKNGEMSGRTNSVRWIRDPPEVSIKKF